MGIALIVVAGIVIISVVASGFDYLGKKRAADQPASPSSMAETVALLEKRVAFLEEELSEKSVKLEQLRTDVSFMNKLIEDKTGNT